MKFSLVTGTLGRHKEWERLLSALDAQTHQDFELIVVDQNADDRLLKYFEPYRTKFPVIHLREKKRGLSRARNIGLRHTSGDIVAFPDDDSYYQPDLLKQIEQFFIQHPEWDGLTCRYVTPDSDTGFRRKDLSSGQLTKMNTWLRSNSSTIFFRREVVTALKGFDETLGTGTEAPWGSGEDRDYCLRAVSKGFKIHYDSQLTVDCPGPIEPEPPRATHKTLSYAMGEGRLMRLHKFPLWFVAYQFIRPLGGIALALLKGNFKRVNIGWMGFKGKIFGWLGTGIQTNNLSGTSS